MQTKLKLRQYQTDLVKKILKTENIKTVCQLDTAGGKSVILSEVCRLLLGVKYIVAHRIELLNQIKKHLCQWISPDQISIVRGSADIDLSAKIFLISVASLQSNADLLPEPSLIVIDEAHHCVAKTYHPLFERYPNAKILGMTATPERLDGKPLGDIFDNLICGPLTSELAEFVAEFDYYAPEWRIKDEGCLTGKEFSAKKIAAANAASTVAKEVYKSYKSLLYGKSTLIFAQSIEHSQEIAAEFTQHKVRCVHLDGTTPEDIRLAAMADLAIGKIDVITSVNLFDEGIDIPSLQGVLIARRTASLTKYLQMCGRVKRQDGSTMKRIVDCTNNWENHGLPTLDRVWSLRGVAGKATELIGNGGMRRNKRTGKVEIENNISTFDEFEIIYRKINTHDRGLNDTKIKSLYDQGLDDNEIRDLIGCSERAIYKWRVRNGLPSNSKIKTVNYVEVKKLYDQGFNDIEISKIIGCSSSIIARWRKNNNLPTNAKRINVIEFKKLINEGLAINKIAKKLNCSVSSLRHLNRTHRYYEPRGSVAKDLLKSTKKDLLTSKKANRSLKKSIDHTEAIGFYQRGLNDKEISLILQCSDKDVWRWRKFHNLPSNYKQKRAKKQ